MSTPIEGLITAEEVRAIRDEILLDYQTSQTLLGQVQVMVEDVEDLDIPGAVVTVGQFNNSRDDITAEIEVGLSSIGAATTSGVTQVNTARDSGIGAVSGASSAATANLTAASTAAVASVNATRDAALPLLTAEVTKAQQEVAKAEAEVARAVLLANSASPVTLANGDVVSSARMMRDDAAAHRNSALEHAVTAQKWAVQSTTVESGQQSAKTYAMQAKDDRVWTASIAQGVSDNELTVRTVHLPAAQASVDAAAMKAVEAQKWAEHPTSPDGTTTKSAKTWAAEANLVAQAWAESPTAPGGVGTKSAKTHATEAGVSSATATTQAGIATTKANEAAASADLFDGFMEKHYPAVPHERRVITDSGTLRNNASALVRILDFVQSNGLQEATEVLICPEATGTKEGAAAGRLSKVYSVLNKTKDAVQATATNQPFLRGSVAPKSSFYLHGSNGTRIVFPQVEFGSKDFIVTLALDGSHFVADDQNHILTDNPSNARIRVSSSGTMNIVSQQGTSINIPSGSFLNYQQRGTYIVSFVRVFDKVRFYLNGVYRTEITIPANNTYGFSHLGRLASPCHTGRVYYARLQQGSLSDSQVQAEHDMLRGLFPEVESVKVGAQEWATSNLDIRVTPAGSTIRNETRGTTTAELFTGFTTIDPKWTDNGNGSYTATAGSTGFMSKGFSGWGLPRKYFRAQVTVSGRTAGSVYPLYDGGTLSKRFPSSSQISTNGTFDQIYISTGTNASNTYWMYGTESFDGTISNLSLVELGWNDAPLIYQFVYDATSGTHTAKHLAALKEAAMWCYYGNTAENGYTYGKLYNGYALQLLALELGSGYGWKIPTVAEYDALLTQVANNVDALKHDGTTYWDAPNTGTNVTGYTLLPSGFRGTDGSFVGLRTIGDLGLLPNTIAEEPQLDPDLAIGRPTRLLKLP